MGMYYMDGKNRRHHQRALNKVFRQLNKSIEDDGLWLGRFAIVQDSTSFYEYERDYWEKRQHPAEYSMSVNYHFVDKKTGRTSRSYHASVYHLKTSLVLFQQMNEFIVVDCHKDVWGAAEKPTRENAVDYRKVAAK